MHVKKAIETNKGTITFEGELSQEEVDLVIQLGLNYLLVNGALPFTTQEDVLAPSSKAVQ